MRLSALAAQISDLRGQLGRQQTTQHVDITGALAQVADLRALIAAARADIIAARADIAQAKLDLAAVKTAYNAHAASNQRHTGTLIGGLL